MFYALRQYHMFPHLYVYNNKLTRFNFMLFLFFCLVKNSIFEFKNYIQKLFRNIISSYNKCIYG